MDIILLDIIKLQHAPLLKFFHKTMTKLYLDSTLHLFFLIKCKGVDLNYGIHIKVRKPIIVNVSPWLKCKLAKSKALQIFH